MSQKTPNFMERIVCLASSRKTHGQCIAGKRVSDGTWCRPVSSRSTHEISDIELTYQNNHRAQLLDIIDVPCVKKDPYIFQSENVLIDEGFYWGSTERMTWQTLRKFVDQNADLWPNGFSAYYNKNNRVPAAMLGQCVGSLRLIELNEIILHVGPKAPQFGNTKTVVRAGFIYRGQEYKMDLTDPEYERVYEAKAFGDYRLKSVIACISLGELHTNQNDDTFAYKLVASVITPETI